MSAISSPYGLRPVKKLGDTPMTHGAREIKLSTNNAAAIYTGDIIQLTSAGNPQSLSATPTTSTAGVVGVCIGVRYSLPQSMGGAVMFGQYLPAGAITAGYTDVWIMVADDPNTIFQVQGSAAFGTLTNGAHGAIGKNAALGNFGGSASTGVSTVNLVVGANGASLASTNTLAVRVIGFVPGTENDTFPELLVKFNAGVHSYNAPLGV
jgi:hypothetical protein